MRETEIINGGNQIWKWVCRRPCTLGLAVFFLAWYLLQLGVFHLVGENVARWWFYLEPPPNTVSPGILFAPLSHDFNNLTHIGSNVFLLLVVGGASEPYIGKDRIMVTVIGLGYLGTYLANCTIILHKIWIVAGASGGILALGAYTGLRLRHHSYENALAGLTWSWQGVETIVWLSLLVGIPIFLIHQTVLIAQPHSGHVIGLILGCLYYGIEAYAGGPEEIASGSSAR